MAKLIQLVTLVIVLFAVMEYSECRGRRGGNGLGNRFPGQHGGGWGGRPHFFMRACQNETEATTASSIGGSSRPPRGELKCTNCIDGLAQICTYQRQSGNGTTEEPEPSNEDVNAPNIDA